MSCRQSAVTKVQRHLVDTMRINDDEVIIESVSGIGTGMA
jgi:hypothetical protein